MDDVERYLAARRRTNRGLLAAAIVVVVASLAIPYVLMRSGIVARETFEMCLMADFVLGMALVRTAVMRLRGGRPSPR